MYDIRERVDISRIAGTSRRRQYNHETQERSSERVKMTDKTHRQASSPNALLRRGGAATRRVQPPPKKECAPNLSSNAISTYGLMKECPAAVGPKKA